MPKLVEVALAALAALAAVVALALPGVASATPWPADPNWQQYVEAPASALVHPVAVIAQAGDVTDAAALTQLGSGATATLTYAPGGTPPSITLDYGRETGGLPQFDVAGVSVPLEFDAAYSETRTYLGATGDLSATPGAFLSGDPVRVQPEIAAGAETITDPLVQGGERYELITLESPGTLRLRAVDIKYTGFHGTAANLRGNFVSSSRLLNRIWYAGVYTVNLDQLPPGTPSDVPAETNGNPVLVDGAKRDRGVWSGDLGISGQTVYYSLDPSYVRGSIELLGAHPGTIATFLAPSAGVASSPGPMPGACAPNGAACVFWGTSYAMLFVDDLYRYYLYTGDLSLVREEWPAVVRELAWDARQLDSSGLIATNQTDGADWNADIHGGEVTYNNVLYYEVLGEGAALAEALGEVGPAQAYLTQAARVAATVKAKLLDRATGIYLPGAGVTGVVQDANVYAILSGLAPQADWAHILTVLDAKLTTKHGVLNVASPVPTGYTQLISPFMGGYQLEAEFEAGRAARALAMMKTEWGWMIDHDPGGTVWEKYTANGTTGSPMTSMAHAWSSGATSALSHFVLGVAPITPGYATLEIEPHPVNLAWAEGAVPTPHGSVTVDWGEGRGGTFSMRAQTPAGTVATLAVPRRRADVVTVGGRVVWNRAGFHARPGVSGARQDASYVFLTGVAPGTRTLSSR